MSTWVEDGKGNKCSVEYFGSEDGARNALASHIDCEDCTNCSNCSRCSDCSGCSDCSRCSGCSNCSDCSDCSDCSNCSNCSNCSRCSGCSDCSRCSDCSGCSNCSRCSDCSGCSNCSRCSDCSDCSRCSGCSGCSNCSRCSGKNETCPAVPSIPDIHKTLYEAVASAPAALDMSSWHYPCGTTHCRAGWVVHKAGEAGYALEKFYNTELAAMLIYKASGYEINPGQFYLSNADALADMKRLVEGEK